MPSLLREAAARNGASSASGSTQFMNGDELAKLPELLGTPMSGESRDCHLPFIIFSQGNATQAPSVAAGVVLMGKLLVRCPKTGQAIFTGRYVDSATFRSTPVFFSRNYCPLCHAMHEWFAKDAWVCDSEYSESEVASAQQVA